MVPYHELERSGDCIVLLLVIEPYGQGGGGEEDTGVIKVKVEEHQHEHPEYH
jgi:hypothetical protein